VLLAFQPQTGFRYVEVRARRSAMDYAEFMKTLSARHYPQATKIRLVEDNLNTHTPGSFHEVLQPMEAFALAEKFEPHSTPKKASWLNLAET
jgi:phenylalanine-4-hydroxylase